MRATNEQVIHLGIVAKTMRDHVLMGLSDSVFSVGVWCDGVRSPCASMGIHQARAVVSRILSGEAVEFTVRPTSPTTRRRISAAQAKSLAALVDSSIEQERAKDATPRGKAIAAAQAALDAADAAWVASLPERGGPGGGISNALEAAAISAAAELRRIARAMERS